MHIQKTGAGGISPPEDAIITNFMPLIKSRAWKALWHVNLSRSDEGALELDDLISAGTVAVLNAHRKFDPEKGAFAAFADLKIKEEFRSLFKENGRWFFSVTEENQVRYRQSGPGKKERAASQPRVNSHCLALRLKYGPELKGRAVEHPSLATPLRDAEGDEIELGDRIQAGDLRYETERSHEKLVAKWRTEEALSELTPREREVIQARRLNDEPETLAEISKRLVISLERVRQIEEAALAKIKSKISSRISGGPVPFANLQSNLGAVYSIEFTAGEGETRPRIIQGVEGTGRRSDRGTFQPSGH